MQVMNKAERKKKWQDRIILYVHSVLLIFMFHNHVVLCSSKGTTWR